MRRLRSVLASLFLAITGICADTAPAQDNTELDRAEAALKKMGCTLDWDDTTIGKVAKACDRALKKRNLTDTQRGFAYFIRGESHAGQGNLSQALSDLDNAATLIPSDGYTFDARAKVHQRLGDMNRYGADLKKGRRTRRRRRHRTFHTAR